MTSRFVESFLAAGLQPGELVPEGVKKAMLCGIKQIVILRDSGDAVVEKLTTDDPALAHKMKWVRFVTISEQRKFWFAILYSHPFKNDCKKAVFDIELSRVPKNGESSSPQNAQRTFVRTKRLDDIHSFEDLFGDTGEIQPIDELLEPSETFSYFLKVDLRMPDEGQSQKPLNELQVFPIENGSSSMKMKPGYRMAFSNLLKLDGCSGYLIKRVRQEPDTFRYKCAVSASYPSVTEGASLNYLKLVFPEGVEIRSFKRTPIFQSCYIAINEGSLEKHMLTFVKFGELQSEEFCESVRFCSPSTTCAISQAIQRCMWTE